MEFLRNVKGMLKLELHSKFQSGSIKVIYHSGYQGMDVRIILNIWIILNLLRVGSNGTLFRTR